MPPKGDPLTHRQKETLRKWIAQGLDFGKWVGQTDGIEKLAQKKNQDTSVFIPEHINFYDKLSAGLKPLPETELSRVAKATGLMIRPVGIGSPLVEVRVVTDPLQVGDAEVEKLRPLKKHLAKLDLRHTDVTDRAMAEIATFSKLTELNLRGTKVGNSGLSNALRLPQLQSLNLCETEVSEKGLGGVKKSMSAAQGFLVGQSGEPGRAAQDSEYPRSQVAGYRSLSRTISKGCCPISRTWLPRETAGVQRMVSSKSIE